MKSRIRCSKLLNRVCPAEEAAAFIQNGMTVAMGGYTSSGYPKAVARELVRRRQQGEELKIHLLSGANVGPLDRLLSSQEIIGRRTPMLEDKTLAAQVNAGKVHYVEQQMNRLPRLTTGGFFGKIDVVVVEALCITEDGFVVPTSSVGMVPYFLELADTVIVEINMAQPTELAGMHDVYLPGIPPHRSPIPLIRVNQKIGTPYIKVDPEKIRFVVRCDEPDETGTLARAGTETGKVVDHLLHFLYHEVKRMPGGRLPPLQIGFGSLAGEIAKGLGKSKFEDLQFFCGGLTEGIMDLVAQGKVQSASTGSIQMTPRTVALLKEHPALYRERVVIRNTDITNGAETVGRLGIVALTTGVEMDMYGNVNSSHITGTKVVNGLGGGANFAENAGLSIVLLVSESKSGAISNIVPMVSHQDISEHDVDVVITENGVADLRGKDDVERARAVIRNCAGIHYKEALEEYLNRAIRQAGGHHPQLLEEAFQWHLRLLETGSMISH